MNLLIKDISTFDWPELHNRVVRVFYTEDSGMQCAALYDTETKEIFIVSVKPVEDK